MIKNANLVVVFSMFTGVALSATPVVVSAQPFADQATPEVITATRLKQSLFDTPASVTVISREMIKSSGARELPDILRLVPGMVVGRESGSEAYVLYHGTNAGGARRMQVQINGRSVYEAALARVDYIGLPFDVAEIERIEVVRGPNSAAHGANSFFAVINIITQHPQDVANVDLLVRAGDNGIADGFARFAGQAGGVDWSLSLMQRQDDGYDTNLTRGTPYQDDKRMQGLNFQAFHALPSDGQLGFSGGFSRVVAEQSRRNDPSIYRELPVATFDNGFLTLDWRQPWSTHNELNVQTSISTLRRDEPWLVKLPYLLVSPELGALYNQDPALADRAINDPAGTCVGPALVTNAVLRNACLLGVSELIAGGGELQEIDYRSSQNYQEQRTAIELSNTWVPNDWLRMVMGAELNDKQASSEIFLNGTVSNRSVNYFAHGEWRFAPDWLLNLGANVEDDDTAGRFFSPRAALNWRFLPEHSLRLVHARAVRTPDIIETSADWRFVARTEDRSMSDKDGQFYITAKSEGKPKTERIQSNELGYYGELRDIGVALDIRLFYDELRLVDNQIEIDGFELSELNDYLRTGLEVESSWRFAAHDQLRLTYTHINLRDLDNANNGNVNFVPRHMGTLGWLHHDAQGWQGSLMYGFYNNLNRNSFFDRLDGYIGKTTRLGQQYWLDLGLSAQVRLTRDPEMRRENGVDQQHKLWLSAGLRY
ncbi:MAG: TonB-dependent receptor [Moraxellaceae bacterium]|nr:TonB-dependent receptor [Moraxellaceae bacterium]